MPAGAASRRLFAVLNLVGGVCVLGSYAIGLLSYPESRGAVWGNVPGALRPLYSVSMLLAAAGYFPFSHYVYLALDSDRVRVFGRYGFGAFNAIYALILLPSVLWMPLTFRMIEQPDALLWFAIRSVLFVVGLASLALIAAIASAQPAGAPGARRWALIGAALFALQTALLDALVWPAYFPA